MIACQGFDAQSRKPLSVDVDGPLTVTRREHGLEAALAGLGIAFVPEPLVLGHLEAGRLERLLDDWSPAFEGYCLYYPANRHPPTALKLFADIVREWGRVKNVSK